MENSIFLVLHNLMHGKGQRLNMLVKKLQGIIMQLPKFGHLTHSHTKEKGKDFSSQMASLGFAQRKGTFTSHFQALS